MSSVIRKIFHPSRIYPVVLILLMIVVYKCRESDMQQIHGETMGGIGYTIKYTNSTADYKDEIDDLLDVFNGVLSTYDSTSEISKLNREGVLRQPSPYFVAVYDEARVVHQQSDGAFDPTVTPIINAWGFGHVKVKHAPDSATVDSLRALVDFSAIAYHGDSLYTTKKGVGLDFSAIAKGYACDVVAQFLDAQDIEGYMIEIGGEVRCKGTKDDGEVWRIGVERPMENGQSVLSAVPLKNRSMATSGNYRNQRTYAGKRFGHTLDPRTGYPIVNQLKSATVFADNCMRADAFATAMMVLGVEESIRLDEEFEDIQVYLVFEKDGGLETYASEGVLIEVQE